MKLYSISPSRSASLWSVIRQSEDTSRSSKKLSERGRQFIFVTKTRSIYGIMSRKTLCPPSTIASAPDISIVVEPIFRPIRAGHFVSLRCAVRELGAVDGRVAACQNYISAPPERPAAGEIGKGPPADNDGSAARELDKMLPVGLQNDRLRTAGAYAPVGINCNYCVHGFSFQTAMGILVLSSEYS